MPVIGPPEWVGGLTPRQAEVTAMWHRGLPVARIADELGVSPNTVRSQLEEVRRRMDCPELWQVREQWEQHRGAWAWELLRRAGIPVSEVAALEEQERGA